MLLGEGGRRTIGSKAFDLYRCRLLGARVPDFVVVPARFHAMADRDEALALLRVHLERALVELGGAVAVRSSSPAEDLDENSMAGQFRTVLRVSTCSALEAALLEVWRSSGHHPMAVIIQRMLEPDTAGVLFTRDPVTGADRTVIERVDGLAEPLVSGRCDPERVVLPNDREAGPDHPFGELAGLAGRLEKGFGYPLDIEWAQCGADLYILQARPITHLSPPDLRSGPSYSRVHAEEFFSGPVTPLFHSFFGHLYSRYYIGETLDILGIGVSMDYPVLVRHRNYLYADTRLTEYTLSSTPSWLGRKRLMEVLPPDIAEEVSGKAGRTDPTGLLRLLGFLLSHPALWISNLDRHFSEEVVPEILQRLDGMGDFGGMGARKLLEAYDEILGIAALHIRTSKWGLGLYSIPLGDAMARFLDENSIGRENLPALMAGLEGNRTLDASNELRRLAMAIRRNRPARAVLAAEHHDYGSYRRGLAEVPGGDRFNEWFDSVLVRYGHRRLSRDLRSPSWRDEPMIPFRIVRTLVLGDEKAGHATARHGPVKRRIAVRRAIERRLPPGRRWFFRLLSEYLARYTSFRELQRFYLDMILSRMRELVLAMAERMVDDGAIREAGDIFFVDMKDILEHLAGKDTPGLDGKALFNRLTYENQTGTPGRYMRGGVDFDAVRHSAILNRQSKIQNPKSKIHGQGVSPGLHRGRVRVIPDLDRDTVIAGGEVVVTRCLDPGQTHFLMTAGAMILEVGGMLSHGAILARELDVPAVAQVRNATSLFRNGQQVVVNGRDGTITTDR